MQLLIDDSEANITGILKQIKALRRRANSPANREALLEFNTKRYSPKEIREYENAKKE